MKKSSLSHLRKGAFLIMLSVIPASSFAEELGELPLGKEITLNQGDVYTFTPQEDGILSIEFEGTYPGNGLVLSTLYNAAINPEMVMTQLAPFSESTWMGPVSPAMYEIKVNQPLAGAEDKVKYQVVGPDDGGTLDIKATFMVEGEGGVIQLTDLSQTPDGVFDFNTSGNLAFTFEPFVYPVTCNSIVIDMYIEDEFAKSIQGADREITWQYAGAIGYYINLTNLWDYELKDTKIDSFTVTLSDFNYELTGEYVNEEGAIVLHYEVDEFYGMITLEETSGWPQYIFPSGAYPSKVTLTFSGELDPESQGDVRVIGANLSEINSQPADNTPVYEPKVTISGNTATIDFSEFQQIGPTDDNGNIQRTDGYYSRSSVMSIVVQNFLGADGSQVQPLLQKANYTSEKPGDLPDDPSTPGDSDDPDDPEDPEGPDSGVDMAEADGRWEVYDMQGVRILSSDRRESLSTLPSGIYIINGKKTVWNP